MKSRALSESAKHLNYERWLRGRDDREASLRGLRNLARLVFVDRNVSGWNKFGMPKGDRLAIKAEARPFLRESIHWIRKSRDALLSGDIERYELLADRARMYRAFARLEFFQRYANAYGHGLVKIASRSASGHKKKAEIFERENRDELKEFDNLVRGCISRGDSYRVKEWLAAYPMLKRTAMYERIASIRKGL